MPSAKDRNLKALQLRYFDALVQTATRAFLTSPAKVGEYFQSLLSLPRQSQWLAMHDSPLRVVSIVTGIPVTKDIRERYRKQLMEQPDEKHPDPMLDSPVFYVSPDEPVEPLVSFLHLAGYRELFHDAYSMRWDLQELPKSNVMHSILVLRALQLAEARTVKSVVRELYARLLASPLSPELRKKISDAVAASLDPMS